MINRTKIVATVGPSIDDEDMLAKLLEAGVDIFRLNFSHGTHEEHKVRLDRIKRVRERTGIQCAIMLDTKGPEIRTGLLKGGEPIELREGDELVLAPGEFEGADGRVSQTMPDLAKYVEPGTHILLDDGLIELDVESVDGTDIICRVMNNGALGQRKSVNIPGVSVPLPTLSDKDKSDLLFGIEQEVDFVAASFIRSSEAVREVSDFLDDNCDYHIGVISKIENAQALEDIEGIIKASDGIMVARGDLGVELPPHEVPYLQKKIIHACNCAHKPVITATQMLESMTVNPRPTRAEAADVANAIYDGTDCVMLSGETAVGAHPLEAVQTMARIIETTEEHYFEGAMDHALEDNGRKTVSHAVGRAAVRTAEDIGAKCIVCPTMTGRTARLMSSLRANIPIYSVTPNERVQRQMQIFWGVTPLLGEVVGDMRQVIDVSRDIVADNGYLEVGDIAVITCGDRFTSPITRDEDGNIEKFAPTNVMYVVQLRPEDVCCAIAEGGDDALMTRAFFFNTK